MRFGAGQGSTGRGFNGDRVAGGGKARNNHASRADDLNPTLERMVEVADDAFDFAQLARSTGGSNCLNTVERDASGQLRKRASIN
eukprot:5418088-Prymnesium_polylepis.1